jgi:hypothetical protein
LIPQPASGTERDRSFKSFVESPTRGEQGTAQEVFIGNADDINVTFEDTIAQQIIKASDRTKQFTWLDFGSRNERVSKIIYTAPSVGVYTLTKTFSYSLSGNAYRLDSEILVLT